MQNSENKTFSEKFRDFIRMAWHFVTYDIWRITDAEISGLKVIFINSLKTIYLAVRGFLDDNLQVKASALTYSTLLAIVPFLAVLVGIARGFGFQVSVRNELYAYFPGQQTTLEQAFEFVNNYLDQTQGGVFIGIGLIFLFYTVVNLLSSVENTFNEIWQIKKSRVWFRRVTDYLALVLILPILLTCSSGISIFLSTFKNSIIGNHQILSPLFEVILSIIPFAITILTLTCIYVLLPNTKVKFTNALIAGTVAGISFQVFQFLYISGQIWVSRYNAIYGSFAALPLLLLWLQLSWLICLFGAELSFAAQNVKKFNFERDSRHISRRYKDFLTVLIASLIAKRFANEEQPYTADELSQEYQIPIKITTQILYYLTEVGILNEVIMGNDERITYYQPAVDINKLSVGYLFTKIDEFGSENFKIDTQVMFNKQWQTLLDVRKQYIDSSNSILLKDL